MTRFSDRANKILTAAGWYEGRSIDTDSFRWVYEHVGMVMPPVVESALAEFGLLYLQVPPKIEIEGAAHYNDFNIEAIPYITKDWLATKEHGAMLYPVGDCLREYCQILMDDQGNVVLGSNWGIKEQAGASFEEAIEWFCVPR